MRTVKEELLHLLERDGRLTYRELAALVGETEENVEKYVVELECDGVISGYGALVNWDKASGDDVSAVIELKVTLHKSSGFDEIAAKISNYSEVEALYLMSGSYDFMVILRQAPMREIARFVNKLAVLDEVISTATHIVLVRYKDHSTVLIDPKEDKRIAGNH